MYSSIGATFTQPCDRTSDSSLFAIACIILGIIAMIGNLWVILVFALGKVSRNSCNLLITNLAVLDFMTGFIIAITHILRKVEKPKGTGIDAHLFCFVFCAEYPLWTFVNASIINLILITLERYLCVVSPVYHKNVFSQSKNIILRLGVIWVLAPICALYNHFAWETNSHGCDLKKDAAIRLWGGVWALVSMLIAPTIFMATAYTHLSHSLKVLPMDNQGKRMNRRITISCLAVTVTFFVCWAPDEILFFIRSLSTLGIDVNFNKAVLKAVYYVGLFNCTLNPVLYAFFNPNYRKAFMYLKNLKLFFQSTKDENKSIITAFSSFSAAADDDAVINREFQTT